MSFQIDLLIEDDTEKEQTVLEALQKIKQGLDMLQSNDVRTNVTKKALQNLYIYPSYQYTISRVNEIKPYPF